MNNKKDEIEKSIDENFLLIDNLLTIKKFMAFNIWGMNLAKSVFEDRKDEINTLSKNRIQTILEIVENQCLSLEQDYTMLKVTEYQSDKYYEVIQLIKYYTIIECKLENILEQK